MSARRSSLPRGWARVRLGDVVAESREKVEPQSVPDEPYLGMEHVEAQTMRLVGQAKAGEYKSSANAFAPGQVLYGRLRPYLNKVFVADFGGACSSEFIVLQPTELIRADYLARLLNLQAFVTFAGTLDTGDRPRVRYKQIAEYEFELPPLAEQERIMKAVREEEARLTKATEDLKHARAAIALLRIAVLEELGKTDAPLTRVDAVGDVFVGSTPKRGVAEFWNGDVPWVSSSEVAFCRIASTKERITEAGLGKRETRLQPSGTVLLAMYGEGKTRGQAAILDIEAATNQAVAAVRLDDEKMLPEFLYYCFMRQYAAVRKFGRGGQQLNLNKDLVKSIEIPCPSIEVQEDLIQHVEAALLAADQNEADLASLERLSADATSALLRDALAGELVAQDSADEHVSEALERLGSLQEAPTPQRVRKRGAAVAA